MVPLTGRDEAAGTISYTHPESGEDKQHLSLAALANCNGKPTGRCAGGAWRRL